MKTILSVAAGIACCACLQAQTLTINADGVVRLDPPSERTVELYAAHNPRSDNWELVTEFDQLTQVDTNRTRFYRAYVKGPPLKLIAITETNQTLRGSCDKVFTNITLLIGGVALEGWSSGQINRRDKLLSFDFSFSRIPVSVSTPALLTIWDEDGYKLETNVFISSGPFVPQTPRRFRAGITPASANAQTTLGWAITSHWSSELTTGRPPEDSPDCTWSDTRFNGYWDGSGCYLEMGNKFCRHGQMEDCGWSYKGGTAGPMDLLNSRGSCASPKTKAYSAWAEIGSYNSDVDDVLFDSRFEHSAFAPAEMWIGGGLRGAAESNYLVIVSIGLEKPVERLGGNEVIWEPASSTAINSIGGSRTQANSIFIRVPPDGVLINVTPGFSKFAKGWYHYWPTYVLMPAEMP